MRSIMGGWISKGPWEGTCTGETEDEQSRVVETVAISKNVTDRGGGGWFLAEKGGLHHLGTKRNLPETAQSSPSPVRATDGRQTYRKRGASRERISKPTRKPQGASAIVNFQGGTIESFVGQKGVSRGSERHEGRGKVTPKRPPNNEGG